MPAITTEKKSIATKPSVTTFLKASGRFSKNSIEQLLITPLKDTAFHLFLWPLFSAKNQTLLCIDRYSPIKTADIIDQLSAKISEGSDEDVKRTLLDRMLDFHTHRVHSFFSRYSLDKYLAVAKTRTTSLNASEVIVPFYVKNETRNKWGASLAEMNKNKGTLTCYFEHQMNVLLFRPLGYIEKDVIGIPAKITQIFVQAAFSTCVKNPVIFTSKWTIRTLRDMKADRAVKKAEKAFNNYKAKWDNPQKKEKLTKALSKPSVAKKAHREYLHVSDLVVKALKVANTFYTNDDNAFYDQVDGKECDVTKGILNKIAKVTKEYPKMIASWKNASSIEEVQTQYEMLKEKTESGEVLQIPVNATNKQKAKLYQQQALRFLQAKQIDLEKQETSYPASVRKAHKYFWESLQRSNHAEELKSAFASLPPMRIM